MLPRPPEAEPRHSAKRGVNSAVFPLGEGPCRSHRSGARRKVRCLFFRRAARAACDCRLRALVPSAGLPSRPCNANAGCDCTLQQAIPSVEAARYPSGSSGIWGEAAAQRNRILHSCGAISSEPQNARRNCSRSLAFADERHRLQLQHTIAACVGRALGQWCRCSLWIDQNGLPCGFASRAERSKCGCGVRLRRARDGPLWRAGHMAQDPCCCGHGPKRPCRGP